MRTTFIKKLMLLAEKDPRIMLLVGDLGYNVVNDFAKRFPKQFLNVGVAEQNLTGVATGLALTGRIVFTYSIGNFPTLRCLEQIRNDICYHKANVIAVSIGTGFAYGGHGVTHQALEDIAIMRSLPNLTLIAPGDPLETEAATEYLAQGVGPAYLRLGKAGEPVVHSPENTWQFGKLLETRPGTDLTLISTGAMLYTCVLAAEKLAAEYHLSACVVSMHTIKPIDFEGICQVARQTPAIFTVEEHSIIGGLGSTVAETLAESGIPVKFKRIGTPSVFPKEVGCQNYLKNVYRLDVDGIIQTVLESLKK